MKDSAPWPKTSFVLQAHSVTFDICTIWVEKISITDTLSILLIQNYYYIVLIFHNFRPLARQDDNSPRIFCSYILFFFTRTRTTRSAPVISSNNGYSKRAIEFARETEWNKIVFWRLGNFCNEILCESLAFHRLYGIPMWTFFFFLLYNS